MAILVRPSEQRLVLHNLSWETYEHMLTDLAERMRGKAQIDLTVDPPPDLVIEIDPTRSSLDKLPIYTQIGVPEVWRYIGQRLMILVLREGAYHERNDSAALPGVKSETVSA